MTSRYIPHNFNLSKEQINKVGKAINDERAISIKIKKDQYHGEHPLPLTLTELNKINDADRPEITVHLSAKKLIHMKNNSEHKVGGWVGPVISAVTTAAPYIIEGGKAIYNYFTGNNAECEREQELEREREHELEWGRTLDRIHEKVQLLNDNDVRTENNDVGNYVNNMLSKVRKGRGVSTPCSLEPFGRFCSSNAIGQDTTTNSDLETYAKKLKIKYFRGVFMDDELPMKIKTNECGIVNLQDSDEQGSHWVCYFKKGKLKYYFDSYGLDCSNEVLNYLKRPIISSTYQIQKMGSTMCGQYCLYVLFYLGEGYDFIDILHKLLGKQGGDLNEDLHTIGDITEIAELFA